MFVEFFLLQCWSRRQCLRVLWKPFGQLVHLDVVRESSFAFYLWYPLLLGRNKTGLAILFNVHQSKSAPRSLQPALDYKNGILSCLSSSPDVELYFYSCSSQTCSLDKALTLKSTLSCSLLGVFLQPGLGSNKYNTTMSNHISFKKTNYTLLGERTMKNRNGVLWAQNLIACFLIIAASFYLPFPLWRPQIVGRKLL